MRPLGGCLFGHLGDSKGRRHALALSIVLMAGPTFLIGCLPTFAQAGLVATVLLTVVRLLQGVSVGGQLVGSFVYVCESCPPGYVAKTEGQRQCNTCDLGKYATGDNARCVGCPDMGGVQCANGLVQPENGFWSPAVLTEAGNNATGGTHEQFNATTLVFRCLSDGAACEARR